MKRIFSKFIRDDDGAVTVDWVVLTAAAVGLAAGAGTSMLSAVETLSSNISTEVTTKTVDNGD